MLLGRTWEIQRMLSGETWLHQGCRNQHLGCMSVSASGTAAAAAAASGAAFGGSHPPGMAGSGMMWKHEMLGGHWQWAPGLQSSHTLDLRRSQVQHHIVGHMDVSHMKFDCLAGFSKWQSGWSAGKKDWKGGVGAPRPTPQAT